MSLLVVALTLAAFAPPPPSPPPAPRVALQVDRPMLFATTGCRDIDPAFVRGVAPPSGAGPLWAVHQRLEVRPPVTGLPRFDCPRLVAVTP
jgi:hypothetical protein